MKFRVLPVFALGCMLISLVEIRAAQASSLCRR